MSQFKGVYPKGKSWEVRLKLAGKCHYFGCYQDQAIAAKVYDFHAVKLIGKHARCNFPECTDFKPPVRKSSAMRIRHFHKLGFLKAESLRKDHKDGMSVIDLASKYGISKVAVNNILKNISYSKNLVSCGGTALIDVIYSSSKIGLEGTGR